MSTINDETVIEKSIRLGGFFAKDIARGVLDKRADEAYNEAIEVGITNTVLALLDASVDENTIEMMLNKYWDISKTEADGRIDFGKAEILKQCIHDYLWRQGESEEQIRNIMKETKATIKIMHNLELYKYKDKPKKLFQIISE